VLLHAGKILLGAALMVIAGNSVVFLTILACTVFGRPVGLCAHVWSTQTLSCLTKSLIGAGSSPRFVCVYFGLAAYGQLYNTSCRVVIALTPEHLFQGAL
jgi:hypothetical protein